MGDWKSRFGQRDGAGGGVTATMRVLEDLAALGETNGSVETRSSDTGIYVLDAYVV